MVNWDFLIDESAVASVLPDEYAHFRRPVREALAVFLGGLPARLQDDILTQQATLPATAAAPERLALLARSCPALHKLGQVLARDRRLGAELRRHLQELESLPPSVPLETIEDILTRELGPLEQRGVALTPPALAEASVAVVIPFEQRCTVWKEGPSQGVFKVLKPGIEKRLEQELELLGRIGSHLDERCDEYRAPHLDYQESFDQVREKLRHEVRLDLEQRHLALARIAYAGEARVQVPAVLEHCTARVTAMERVTGRKVTDHGLAPGIAPRQLANLVAEALVAHPVFSTNRRALFHGDPHAGNLFFTTDGRLAILDWSLIGFLDEVHRLALAQIGLGALALDPVRVMGALMALDEGERVDRPGLHLVVDASLARVRRGQFPGLTWLIGMLDEAVQIARLRPGPDLLLFRKALHTLDGVVTDIAAGPQGIDNALLGELTRLMIVEWPLRWLTPPSSRELPTRLSNADLGWVALNFPWTVARAWLEQVRLGP
jgi:ubiquinone biosynthesis protein